MNNLVKLLLVINMDEDIFKIIGDNIKKYRIKKGYNIEDLALMTELDKEYLTKIEKEGVDGSITFNNLSKIATCLDINIINLFKKKEE